jgi:hypothetical protein
VGGRLSCQLFVRPELANASSIMSIPFPNSFLVHLVTLHTLMMGGSKTKVVVGLNNVGVLVTGQPLNLSENSSGWQLLL